MSNNDVNIKGIISDLDDLCKRLQDDYNGDSAFEQGEDDRLAIYNAIELLEKQIPMKPTWVDSVPHSRCSVCRNAVSVYIDSPKLPYCYWCGQALDWSDTE